MSVRGANNRESSYYVLVGGTANYSPLLGGLYSADSVDMPPPKSVTTKDSDGKDVVHVGEKRKGKPSIFNRYSIFYYNSVVSHAKDPEPYFDAPDRLGDISSAGSAIQSVIEYPTARNIINWSQQGGADGGTNAVEYAWEDFLWCKNYGIIPNNYMVTLRRFPIPVSDDLLDFKKQPAPDIGRLISWVDGEINKWENVGLKFSTSMKWQELESEIQSINPNRAGNEGNLFQNPLGNIIKQASALTQPGYSKLPNPAISQINPYENKNVVFGPIDIIKKMMTRMPGLEFTQEMEIKFEYELRSIDGINPKIAMIDLLSNILVVTANRGEWWGGEIRYFGLSPRQIKPLGDTSKLEKGDLGGYLKSVVSTISSRLDTLTGGAGFSMDSIASAAKNIGGGLMNNIIGGGLDKMGRPGVQSLSALLSGEDTGEWHVMVGNPANPIISVGNLVLDSTDISFDGALGPDDFPSKLTVTCKLKPARPRDRTDMMSMFHRNGRTYLTSPPSAKKYAGNKVKGGFISGNLPPGDKATNFNPQTISAQGSELATERFPNHMGTDKGYILDNAAQGIF